MEAAKSRWLGGPGRECHLGKADDNERKLAKLGRHDLQMVLLEGDPPGTSAWPR